MSYCPGAYAVFCIYANARDKTGFDLAGADKYENVFCI